MSIEENLDRIATALEKIAAHGAIANKQQETIVNVVATASKTEEDKRTLGAARQRIAEAKAEADRTAFEDKAAADAAAAATAATTSTSKATKDDVRKALQAYREIEGTPAMLEVLKGFGAANLNELKEAQYDEVVAKVS
jgi:hypothetical protein